MWQDSSVKVEIEILEKNFVPGKSILKVSFFDCDILQIETGALLTSLTNIYLALVNFGWDESMKSHSTIK